MQKIFEGIIGKILDECANEMFSAEVYNDELDGTTITNLICLGNVRDVLERNIDELKKVPFEAFEKIKERLAAEKTHKTFCDKEVGFNKGIRKAIEIVNQVAEEYNQSLANNNQSLTNDGWIPVSERLPERCEWYLVTYKFHEVSKATCHELYYGADYGYEPGWYLDDEYTELDAPFDVIAWRELPKPYQPKGE